MNNGTGSPSGHGSGFGYSMSMDFEYVRPPRLSTASKFLASRRDAMVLAGGTDLLIEMRSRKVTSGLIIDLKGIDRLSTLRLTTTEDGGYLHVGSLVTINRLLDDRRIRRLFPGLFQAAENFACHEIRERATVGGNIAHGSPGADMSVILLALDARVIIEGTGESRTVPLADFFTGPGTTVLKSNEGEIISGVRIPVPPRDVPASSAYRRYQRVKGMDLACTSLAISVIWPSEPDRREVRVAAGAVASTPVLLSETGQMLSRDEWTPDLIENAVKQLLGSINPRTGSVRTSPEYKKRILGVYMREMLAKLDTSGSDDGGTGEVK